MNDDVLALVERGKTLAAAQTADEERRRAALLAEKAVFEAELLDKTFAYAPALREYASFDCEMEEYAGMQVFRLLVEPPDCAPLCVQVGASADFKERKFVPGSLWIAEMDTYVMDFDVVECETGDDAYVVSSRRLRIDGTRSSEQFADLLAVTMAEAFRMGDERPAAEEVCATCNDRAKSLALNEIARKIRFDGRFEVWLDLLGRMENASKISGDTLITCEVLVDIAHSLSDIRDEIVKRGL